MSKSIVVKDLGLCLYEEVLEIQQQYFENLINNKLNKEATVSLPNVLILCQHYPVITIGKSGKTNHLLVDERKLENEKIAFLKVNRGGDITMHNPGQLVFYPILDLDFFFNDVKKYMWSLEEVIIRALKEFDIHATRSVGETGVWLDLKNRPRKIAALGVKMSRWVTMHGFALNVNNDLSVFDYIIPCGIANKSVTSMQNELMQQVDLEEIKISLIKNFANIFEANIELTY